ncbi:hypothetical protein GCM10018952_05360 [Streptosporangium vulgare]
MIGDDPDGHPMFDESTGRPARTQIDTRPTHGAVVIVRSSLLARDIVALVPVAPGLSPPCSATDGDREPAEKLLNSPSPPCEADEVGVRLGYETPVGLAPPKQRALAETRSTRYAKSATACVFVRQRQRAVRDRLVAGVRYEDIAAGEPAIWYRLTMTARKALRAN